MIIANVLQATAAPASTGAAGDMSVPVSGAASGSAPGFAAHLTQAAGPATRAGVAGGLVGLAPAGGARELKMMASAAAQLLGSTAIPQSEGGATTAPVPGLFAGQVTAVRPGSGMQADGSGEGADMAAGAGQPDMAGEVEASATVAALAGTLLSGDNGRQVPTVASGTAGQGKVPAHADVRAGGSVVHGLGAGKAALAGEVSSAASMAGAVQDQAGAQSHEVKAPGKGVIAPLAGGQAGGLAGGLAGIGGVAGGPETVGAGGGGIAAGVMAGGNPGSGSEEASLPTAAAAAGRATAGSAQPVQRGAVPVNEGAQAQMRPVMFPALNGGASTAHNSAAAQVSAAAAASEGSIPQVKTGVGAEGLPAGKASSSDLGGATVAGTEASSGASSPGAPRSASADASADVSARASAQASAPAKAAMAQSGGAQTAEDADKKSPPVDGAVPARAGQSAAAQSVAARGGAPAYGAEAGEVEIRASLAVTNADTGALAAKEKAPERAAAMAPGLMAAGSAAPSGREGQAAGEPLADEEADEAGDRKPTANGNVTAVRNAAAAATSPASARPGVSAAALAFVAAMNDRAGTQSETDTDGALEFGRAEPMPGSSASHAMARGTAPQPLPQHAAAASVQVASEVARQVSKGVNRFQIRLDPAELGRIDVDMKIGADGTVRAHLAVERSETLDMFLRDQRSLERALDAAGLKLDGGSLQFSLKDQGGFAGFGREGAGEPMADTGGNADEAVAEEVADAAAIPARGRVDGASGALDIQI